MKAVVVNCTLKPSPEQSNTEQLARTVTSTLEQHDVTVRWFRLADMTIDHGVQTSMSEDDEWPAVHDAIVAADILVVATPTWVGHPASYAQQTLERLDAMISETRPDGEPMALGKVAGIVVTGNEDGAHHVISEISGGLVDIGFTIPGQAWTYWNRGPGPGPQYTETDAGHDWSQETGRTMATRLVEVARALATAGV